MHVCAVRVTALCLCVTVVVSESVVMEMDGPEFSCVRDSRTVRRPGPACAAYAT